LLFRCIFISKSSNSDIFVQNIIGMFRKSLFFSFLLLVAFFVSGQPVPTSSPSLNRPKLVVGIVVDQMRWDYLYRYYDRYGNGGFRRLLNEGFSCENTLINYLPSYTAVGHTCVFTGSVPSIHGIAGNDWTEQLTGKTVYCTDDSTVQTVGADGNEGRMSPSSYYMQQLPDWVNRFNNENRIQQLVKKEWTTLYPINTYKESDPDDESYEGKLNGEQAPVFPHNIKEAYEKSKGSFRSTPFGNTFTLDFAAAALEAYHLGRGPATDFLTINCASTDYVGHLFGPNSIEVEDTYLRLDLDLAKFFTLLDNKIGKGKYTGAANAVGYMQQHHLPADFLDAKTVVDALNALLLEKFGVEKLVRSGMNYQINFDMNAIDTRQLNFDSIKKVTVDYLRRQPGITYAIDVSKIGEEPVPEPLKTMIINGYNFKRSGPVQVVFDAGWLETYAKTGTTHGAWNPYDTHIPLVFMGWGIHHGSTSARVNMTDIAPTIAALLHIQMPDGSIGVPIQALTR
jgi:predicted AlkP superfamily pyrophosphatase or phosphodiesterase